MTTTTTRIIRLAVEATQRVMYVHPSDHCQTNFRPRTHARARTVKFASQKHWPAVALEAIPSSHMPCVLQTPRTTLPGTAPAGPNIAPGHSYRWTTRMHACMHACMHAYVHTCMHQCQTWTSALHKKSVAPALANTAHKPATHATSSCTYVRWYPYTSYIQGIFAHERVSARTHTDAHTHTHTHLTRFDCAANWVGHSPETVSTLFTVVATKAKPATRNIHTCMI